MKLVRVHWLDSAGLHDGPWTDRGTTLDVLHCVSVGFLLRKTKKAVIIVSTYDDNEEPRVAQPWAIPRRAITKLERLD